MTNMRSVNKEKIVALIVSAPVGTLQNPVVCSACLAVGDFVVVVNDDDANQE